MSAPHQPPSPEWILRCPACRGERRYTERSLLDRLWAGWPRCCGRDVVLIPGGDDPPPDVVVAERRE